MPDRFSSQSFTYLKEHSGPHLRNECTTENWAYGPFAFINMDMSRGYDQISCQVSTRVCKFSSEGGLAVQHSKSG